jgi:hypothetical protein
MGQKRIATVTGDVLGAGTASVEQVAEFTIASGTKNYELISSAPFGFTITRAEFEVATGHASTSALFSATGGTGDQRSGTIDTTVKGLNVELPLVGGPQRTVVAGSALWFYTGDNAVKGSLRVYFRPT